MERMPVDLRADQRVIRAADYVPVQNQYGGFVYAGGTMAFTAAYWALGVLRPKVIAMLGCDMVYAAADKTHFYGKGAPDPLRKDVTLRSLEAKSARLMAIASKQGCAIVNLSVADDSRLVFPRGTPDALARVAPAPIDTALMKKAEAMEDALGYVVPSGKYWKEEDRFKVDAIDTLDALWLKATRAG